MKRSLNRAELAEFVRALPIADIVQLGDIDTCREEIAEHVAVALATEVDAKEEDAYWESKPVKKFLKD